MANPPVRLKVLLRERHWQTYRTFCDEYDRAAKSVDPRLVGTWPSKAQLYRWVSGELKGLPYPDHCRVLEQMLPGWTTEQLFERCPPVDSQQPASDDQDLRTADVSELLDAIEDRLDAPESGDVNWGTAQRVPAVVTGRQFPPANTRDDVSDHARDLGRSLLKLQETRQLSDQEVRELASLSGHVIELAETVDIDIDAEGNADVAYRFDLLNLSDKPLTRMTREVWFEHTNGPLAITPTPDSDRRVVIQRIHDTTNLAKFAFQISPPLKPGESAHVGYACSGGKFDENHHWRQTVPRYTRKLTLKIRQQRIQLAGCTATEEHPDGSENSATDSLVWDFEGEDAIMIVTRTYLRPSQAVTLRWEIIRGPA